MANKNDDVEVNIPQGFEWGVFALGILMVIVSVFYGVRSDSSLDSELVSVQNEVTTLKSEKLDREKTERELRNEVIYETTGIDPKIVKDDGILFDKFIEPAFEWTSGDEYDEMRDEYIELLGEKSSFITTYIAENNKVDQYNYIDLHELKSKFLSTSVYPLEERDDSMDYMGVVRYYPYLEKSDLVGVNRLLSSKAMVRYTVSGQGDRRKVSAITAVPGFSSDSN